MKEKTWHIIWIEQIYTNSFHMQYKTWYYNRYSIKQYDNLIKQRSTLSRHDLWSKAEISLTFKIYHQERYQICFDIIQHRKNYMRYLIQIHEKIIHYNDKTKNSIWSNNLTQIREYMKLLNHRPSDQFDVNITSRHENNHKMH